MRLLGHLQQRVPLAAGGRVAEVVFAAREKRRPPAREPQTLNAMRMLFLQAENARMEHGG